MKLSDFDYHLPPERIAQTPLEPRDASRLLVLQRPSGEVAHDQFSRIGDYLRSGDLLVVNQTRVLPARIFAHKIPSGGKVELLLLNQRDSRTWEVLVGGKRVNRGKKLLITDDLEAEVIADLDGPRRLVQFSHPIEEVLPHIGQMPLPPYIHERLGDPERYQTVYAEETGSAAAPTAGLHFTPSLIASLEQKGVEFAYLTLHVGLDTFAPVTEEDVTQHHIHTEWCRLTPEVARRVNAARKEGRRVIAVGTTSVRTLESAAVPDGVTPFEGQTELYILPGYRFNVVDALITNFHLPRSTLLMLVSAFAGREHILAAYQAAIEEQYRFYSFGDAMLIV